MKYKKWPLISGITCFSAIITLLCSGFAKSPEASSVTNISAADLINAPQSSQSVPAQKKPQGSSAVIVSSSEGAVFSSTATAATAPTSTASSSSSTSSTSSSSKPQLSVSSSSAEQETTDIPEAPAAASTTVDTVSTPEPVAEPEPAPEPAYSYAPEPLSKFDEPESYLLYDESGWRNLLTAEEEAIGESSLFAGDSTCYGFSAWNVVPDKNVYASGGAAARNILTFENMYYLGRRMTLPQVLSELKPKRVFFWVGMNDVNMTSAEDFCENYREVIDTVLKSSDAEVYVCATTPISDLNFTDPERIDLFNRSIRNYVRKNYSSRVHCVNFADPLRAENGLLDEQYNGGDGIHLRSKAYYVAMHEICKEVKRCEGKI